MSRGNYIAGAWSAGQGASFASLDPAAQLPVWEGRAAAAAEVDAAVRAARAAFDSWRKEAPERRIAHVQAFKDLLQRRAEEFAELIARETGKPRWDSRGEVQAMLGKADISVRAYRERTGESAGEGNVRPVLRHAPHGVMAVFGPYNFPGHLPNGHIMPALIAGNTVVFKPSDLAPLVAERMVALWEEAGLPHGVMNLAQGGRETGEALAAHAEVDGILFTGSAEVGALLHKQFGGQPHKLLALEMGGNNPLVVHEAADAQSAALLVLQSAFLSSGQRCSCARRLILPQSAANDAVLEKLRALAQKITVGGYADSPEPFMGPLVSNREAEKLLAAQSALENGGGEVLLRLRRLREGFPFLSPGIIDVTAVQNRPDREYFGPLLQVVRVADFAAALREANDTRFGLSAGLISDDPARWQEFRREIRAGVVNWNRPTNGASSALPFGGVGASGNHRASAYYAADYCAYPVSSQECEKVLPPDIPLPGIVA